MSMEKVIQRRSILTTIPPTFTTHAFKTTDFTTIPSNINMCHHNGRWYMPGTLIEKGQSGNWCYSTYCSHDGHLLYGDNFHCMTTIPVFTTVPTTLPTTTTPTPTVRHHSHVLLFQRPNHRRNGCLARWNRGQIE